MQIVLDSRSMKIGQGISMKAIIDRQNNYIIDAQSHWLNKTSKNKFFRPHDSIASRLKIVG